MAIILILEEQIKIFLDEIKTVKGVENAVLTQRDGNPIQATGVWLSKDEIFEVCSASSAIYNVGIHLHPRELKYILIEGEKAKIIIAPLKTGTSSAIDRVLELQGLDRQSEEYFIAITTQPNVNLGGIFLKTRESLVKIKRALITSGESFKPPLIKYSTGKLENIIGAFNLKEHIGGEHTISRFSYGIPESAIGEIENLLVKFARSIPDIQYSCVTLNGGFVVSSFISPAVPFFNQEVESAMNYSLFSTSNRCAWLLKKMVASSILLECESYFQFITSLKSGLFSSSIRKGKAKLGILRLLIPKYSTIIQKIIEKAIVEQKPVELFNLRDEFGQLTIK